MRVVKWERELGSVGKMNGEGVCVGVKRKGEEGGRLWTEGRGLEAGDFQREDG
jgi:hypothetical protein